MWTCRMIEVERTLVTEPCSCSDPACTIERRYFTVTDKATGQALRVGDVFFAPWFLDPDFGENKNSWTPRYLSLPEPRRAPIVVVCPGMRWLCIDQRFYDHAHGGWYGDGWNIAGEPPMLTLTPSVDLKHSWHGYLEAGVLKDDVDGRTYDGDGKLLPKAAA